MTEWFSECAKNRTMKYNSIKIMQARGKILNDFVRFNKTILCVHMNIDITLYRVKNVLSLAYIL